MPLHPFFLFSNDSFVLRVASEFQPLLLLLYWNSNRYDNFALRLELESLFDLDHCDLSTVNLLENFTKSFFCFDNEVQ